MLQEKIVAHARKDVTTVVQEEMTVVTTEARVLKDVTKERLVLKTMTIKRRRKTNLSFQYKNPGYCRGFYFFANIRMLKCRL